jgi:hypothetical protein
VKKSEKEPLVEAKGGPTEKKAKQIEVDKAILGKTSGLDW